MATITNQCDVLLQATVPRMLSVSSNFITVTATTSAFSTTATGVSPSSITVRASLSGELTGTVTWAVSPAVAYTTSGNTLTLPATSVSPGSSVSITATLTRLGQTYTNSINIAHQSNTVTSSLSASAITISTNTDGTGGSYTSATSTMSVNIGTADDSANWSYSWSVPGTVTATGAATRTITVSAMTADTASLTCTATRTGWATQTKTFVVSKSKSGINGSATYLINRNASTSSAAPINNGTSGETYVAIGRYPVIGDIATIIYNSGANSVAWRCTVGGVAATWVLQTSYITGDLIVSGSVSASKFRGGSFSSDDTLFNLTLGTVSYFDGIGVSWSLGSYLKRLSTATSVAGPIIGIDDVSTNPTTYAMYAYSAKGGAAKFQGHVGNGSNTVYISGTRPDAIQVGIENGSHTRAGVHLLETSSQYGFRVTRITSLSPTQEHAFSAEGYFYSSVTSKGAGLYIKNNYTGGNGWGAIIATYSAAPAIQCENYGGGAGLYSIGSIYTTGDVVSYYSSDRSLKTNIVPITNALSKISQIGGYHYDWKDSVLASKGGEDGIFVRKSDIGVIAQEIQEVLPEIVVKKQDGTLGVRYERLIALVIEAIKELDRRTK